jgi:hypothetical protein
MLGHKCAKLLQAVCVSQQLSRSYGEESLRFTCRHGHNFFLSVINVKRTFRAILSYGKQAPDHFLSGLDWCKKCKNHCEKLKEAVTAKNIVVLSGANADKISLHCLKCSHSFRYSYNKRIENVACPKCQRLSEERREHEEQAR